VRVFKDLQIFSIAFVYAEYIMYNLISSYAISTIRDNIARTSFGCTCDASLSGKIDESTEQ